MHKIYNEYSCMTFHNLQIENNLPDFTELKFKHIHKKYLIVLVLNFVLISSILFASLFFLVKKKLIISIPEYTAYLYLGFGGICLLVLIFLFLGFSKRKYAIREKDISYSKGVLIHPLTTVPFARVQHIELDERPFSRIFKLATIQIYTAGESGGDLRISGIPKNEAIKIKEFITNYINE